jgi:coenzyme PQQ precursor peptide PqqA
LRGNVRATTVLGSKKRVSTVEEMMAWTTPTLVEICIGLEINGYLPAEF